MASYTIAGNGQVPFAMTAPGDENAGSSAFIPQSSPFPAIGMRANLVSDSGVSSGHSMSAALAAV